MNSLNAGWSPRERALLALCITSLGLSIVGYLDLNGSADARPGTGGFGSSISSGEIRNNTIRPQDVRRLTATDLGVYSRYGEFAVRVPAGAVFPAYTVADCNEGDRAIGGGFDAPEGLDLIAFGPTDVRAPIEEQDSWRFGWVNNTNAHLSVGHTEVICMND
jgi:hypothetical protein